MTNDSRYNDKMDLDKDLWRIADHFRKEVKPREINEISDVIKTPNDVLLSYYLGDSPYSVPELVDILKHPTELNEVFTLYYPKARSSEALPSLGNGVNYDMPLRVIASAIQKKTDQFVLGYEDRLLIADKKKEQYTYPSGKSVEHFLLTNEKSANIPIFEGGYANPESGEVIIRDGYITMLVALAQAQSDIFSDYKEQMRFFKRFATGILLAHELSEIELVRADPNLEPGLELDLQSEQKAKKFILENGIPEKYFQLYHLIKALEDERGRNVSKVIVDQGFQPLA